MCIDYLYNRELEYQQGLTTVCKCICERYPNSFMFCAGDFNLPDIHWTSNSIVNHQHPLVVYLNNSCWVAIILLISLDNGMSAMLWYLRGIRVFYFGKTPAYL